MSPDGLQIIRLKNGDAADLLEVFIVGGQKTYSVVTHAGNDHRIVGQEIRILPFGVGQSDYVFIGREHKKVQTEDMFSTLPVMSEARDDLALLAQIAGGWFWNQPFRDRFLKHKFVCRLIHDLEETHAGYLFTRASLQELVALCRVTGESVYEYVGVNEDKTARGNRV